MTVRYLDRDGKPQELAAEGLLATAIQHEIDHLNGKLIIDFLSRLKRDIIVRKFKKQAQGDATARRPAARRRAPSNSRGAVQAMPMLRIVFMGTPDFAVPTLAAIVGGRARGRRRLHAAAAAGRARHGGAQVAGARVRRGGRHSAC